MKKFNCFFSEKEHKPCEKNGVQFINPYQKKLKKTVKDIFLWKISSTKKRIRRRKNFTYPCDYKCLKKDLPKVIWVNHSTFLIEINNVHILTDPVFSKVCSPLAFIGPKRKHEPILSIENLPSIDFVLISHNHYDHLDSYSVKALQKKNPKLIWIVPEGVKKWFKIKNIDSVIELNWWETAVLKQQKNEFFIHAVPAQHFSGRKGFDYNQTLWCGFVVETKNKKFYFSGDTGYNGKDFSLIGNSFNSIDLSLIPIGAYSPRWFMKPIHISPNEAVKIHKEVQSKFSIGMHWKTFRLSDEPLELPPYDLFKAVEKNQLKADEFLAIDPGIWVNW